MPYAPFCPTLRAQLLKNNNIRFQHRATDSVVKRSIKHSPIDAFLIYHKPITPGYYTQPSKLPINL